MTRTLRYLTTMTMAIAALSLPAIAAAQAEDRDPLRVLAVGDSYAAGEGLPNIQTDEEVCQRALGLDAEGDETPSKAWPVLTKEHFEALGSSTSKHWQVDPFWFTACTGSTSDQFARNATGKGQTQLAEAQADSGTNPWDVVMASFGGNDIGFADTIKDCIGFDSELLDPEVALLGQGTIALTDGMFAGCNDTEAELKQLITDVLPSRLATLYDELADVTTEGGLVTITGYPQLFVEPKYWSNSEKLMNRCHRVSEGDARSLRAATVHMNDVIRQAVTDAANRHPEQTWVFVDVLSAFEPSADASHGLCGADEWINGFSLGGVSEGDWRGLDGGIHEVSSVFSRSYHPNQAGHDGYSKAVIAAIDGSGWRPPPQSAADLDLQNVLMPANVCGDAGSSWAHPPIQLKDGSGVARNDDGSFAGASMTDAVTTASGDYNHDGILDVALRVNCMGQLPEECCVGRLGQDFVTVVFTTINGKLSILGNPIRSMNVEGNPYKTRSTGQGSGNLISTQYLPYPDGVSALVVGHDPTVEIRVVHNFVNGNWTSEPQFPSLKVVNFVSPSDNISCVMYTDLVNCEIQEYSYSVNRPADCALDYGGSITMTSTRTTLECQGDTNRIPDAAVLKYGSTATVGEFTCTSAQSGVTCAGPNNQSFSLARASYSINGESGSTASALPTSSGDSIALSGASICNDAGMYGTQIEMLTSQFRVGLCVDSEFQGWYVGGKQGAQEGIAVKVCHDSVTNGHSVTRAVNNGWTYSVTYDYASESGTLVVTDPDGVVLVEEPSTSILVDNGDFNLPFGSTRSC